MNLMRKQIVPNAIACQDNMAVSDFAKMKLVVNSQIWFAEFHLLVWLTVNKVGSDLVWVVENVLLFQSKNLLTWLVENTVNRVPNVIGAQYSSFGIQSNYWKGTGTLCVVKIDRGTCKLLGVVDVIISFFLILKQIRYVFNKFFGVNARIDSKVFPAADTISNSKHILWDKYCILAAFIDFLRMGTDGAAINEMVVFFSIGFVFEGYALFSFGFGRKLLHAITDLNSELYWSV